MVFWLYFFNSFHFLNCLMIVVLQKTAWNPGGPQSKFHELNIYIIIII